MINIFSPSSNTYFKLLPNEIVNKMLKSQIEKEFMEKLKTFVFDSDETWNDWGNNEMKCVFKEGHNVFDYYFENEDLVNHIDPDTIHYYEGLILNINPNGEEIDQFLILGELNTFFNNFFNINIPNKIRSWITTNNKLPNTIIINGPMWEYEEGHGGPEEFEELDYYFNQTSFIHFEGLEHQEQELSEIQFFNKSIYFYKKQDSINYYDLDDSEKYFVWDYPNSFTQEQKLTWGSYDYFENPRH